MRLYHPKNLFILLILLLVACTTPPPATETLVSASISADGQTIEVQLPAGSTIQEALENAGLSLGSLDRLDPPGYTVLTEGLEINLIRVYEEFEVEQVIIPFEQQLQPSEFLAEGEKQPLQLGENGLQEITYRRLYENGIEVSKTAIKQVVVKEPVPQIMLVGVQASFSPLPIPGRLIYLSDGNAWMMEGTTANRFPLVTSGDLDGRIFSLSDDGSWLLFTRRGEEEETINTLWAIQVDNLEMEIEFDVENIIHFAAWQPGSNNSVSYSTVEPRQAAPGWQANNDFIQRDFSQSGWVSPPETLVETRYGGILGWWGTDFLYSPVADDRLVYAAPDQVGLLLLNEIVTQTRLVDITLLQTRGDWAWVPGVSWGPDGQVIYTVDHAPPEGVATPEESPIFDLMVIPLSGGLPVRLVDDVGMFAYPLASPYQDLPSGERGYQVAFLKAQFPRQSDTSAYRLTVMDRDGSNQYTMFPPLENSGMEPQKHWGVWSPGPLQGGQDYVLAVLYQGNIWLVDSRSGEFWQITGDGRINRVDWK
jgi:hypothetical protein